MPSVLRSAIEVAYDVADVDVDAGYSNPANPGGPQGILDENAAIIKTITEYQEMGKVTEAVQYQRTLHGNLISNPEEAAAAEKPAVDFDALKSLEDDGIDMSFLDALKEKYYGSGYKYYEEEEGGKKGEKEKEKKEKDKGWRPRGRGGGERERESRKRQRGRHPFCEEERKG